MLHAQVARGGLLESLNVRAQNESPGPEYAQRFLPDLTPQRFVFGAEVQHGYPILVFVHVCTRFIR